MMIGLVVFLTALSLVEPMAVNVTGKSSLELKSNSFLFHCEYLYLDGLGCCGTCFIYGCPEGQCCSQYG